MSSDALSSFHKAALEYIAQGYRIIPILPSAKTPYMKQWHERALETAEQANDFFNRNPDANLAFCPEDMGLAIIDADTYKPDCAIGDLNLPETYEIESARGGTHYYFAGTLPSSSQKLGANVDTRGRKSYALLPPSVFEGGTYHVKSERPIAALPIEIEARLAASDKSLSSQETRLDLPGNISAARTRLLDRVRGGSVARIGHHGHDLTYEVACELVRDLGLSPELSLELMLELWYPHCKPNNDIQFVKERVLSAARNGQNAIGAHATAPAAEVFAGANLPAPTQPAAIKWFMSAAEQAAMEEPTWLIPELIPEKKICILVAPKGQFKTFIALDLALSISTGKETFGTQPTSTGLTFYGDHESTHEIAKLHRPAWQAAHGLKPDEETGFYLSREGPHKAIAGEMDSFADDIAHIAKREGRPVKLIVFDTYSATMLGLDENDPNDANGFIRYCRSLIAAFGCSILVPAHSGKDAERGARGSSALPFGADTILEVERTPGTNIVKLKVRHHRGAPERKAPFILEGRPFAGSLVFRTLSREEQQTLDTEENEFSRLKIATALRKLGAFGDDNSISVKALAVNLRPKGEEESDDRWSARVIEAEVRLRRLKRGPLADYCFGEGAKMKWCLPSGSDPDGLD